MKGFAGWAERGRFVGLVDLARIVVAHERRLLVALQDAAERGIDRGAIEINKLRSQTREFNTLVLLAAGQSEISVADALAQRGGCKRFWLCG